MSKEPKQFATLAKKGDKPGLQRLLASDGGN